MAFGDNVLNADHQWSFDNVLTDSIGSLTITNSGGVFVTTPITRDSTHSYQTNGRDDLATVVPDGFSGSGSVTERYCVGGFFQVSQIQGPPVNIYKQGGTNGFMLFMWAGNNLVAQCKSNGKTIQIYSDIALTNNRTYHFLLKYEGNTQSNEFEFYIDGIKQTKNSGDVIPDSQYLTSHTGTHCWGENGTSSTDVDIGDETVIIKAPVNGLSSQWWTWFGNNVSTIPENLINEIIGAGAITELTITSGTQSAMQSQIDAISNSVRGDKLLCILIEPVTGDGDLLLVADNIIFNDRASIHIRYEGNGKLSWINTNNSNGSIGSTINQEINFFTEVDINLNVLNATTLLPIEGIRVYITEDSSGAILVNELSDVSGNISTTYNYLQDEGISGVARKGTSSVYYKSTIITNTITNNGLNATILMIIDE